MNESTSDGLEARLRRLPREIAPERDLWPGVAARIRADARGSRWVPLGLAASVALAAVAVALAWQAVRPAGDDARLRAELLSPYVDARHRYETVWSSVRAGVDPETAAVLERNLEIIRMARAEIEAALAGTPDDPALQALLEATLDAELALYRRARSLSPPAI
jgi:hypothetical protein